MKQETLEEVAERLVKESFSDTFEKFPYGGKLSNKTISESLVIFFKLGAKWQADRMYSDAIEFGKWLDDNAQQREYYPMSAMTMEELFEQHKKK
jgi:hypothetical protein